MHTVLFKRQLKPLDHFRYLSKSVLHPFLKKKQVYNVLISKLLQTLFKTLLRDHLEIRCLYEDKQNPVLHFREEIVSTAQSKRNIIYYIM